MVLQFKCKDEMGLVGQEECLIIIPSILIIRDQIWDDIIFKKVYSYIYQRVFLKDILKADLAKTIIPQKKNEIKITQIFKDSVYLSNGESLLKLILQKLN